MEINNVSTFNNPNSRIFCTAYNSNNTHKRGLIMTQLNDDHLELHSKNKAERYERQKLTFLEDRIKVLEKSIEAIHKVLGRYDMTKGDQ